MSINTKSLDLDTMAWLNNVTLRACSPQDRGVLIDLMCIAHQCTPYGYLIVAGNLPMADLYLAGVSGLASGEWMASRDRLLAARRLSRSELGVLFIPRMVRDGAIAASARAGGKLGGNPALGPRSAPRVVRISLHTYVAALPEHLDTPPVKAAVSEWWEYRQRKRLVLTNAAITRQVNILRPLSPAEAVRWIQCAIDKNWRGFYPPPSDWGTANTEPETEGTRKWTDKTAKG